MKKIFIILSVLFVILSFSACGKQSEEQLYDNSFFEEFPTGDEIITIEIDKNPEAEITLNDGSKILIELRYDVAPNTVANFIAFADEKIYEKLGFTQVRNDCILMTDVIDGEFDPPYFVMDEMIDDNDDLSHDRGTVSMIRQSKSDTLTGQFFILTEEQNHFDSYCTAFGTVIEGLENLDKIASSEKDEDGNLITPVGIQKIKIKTFGEDFPLPTIIRK